MVVLVHTMVVLVHIMVVLVHIMVVLVHIMVVVVHIMSRPLCILRANPGQVPNLYLVILSGYTDDAMKHTFISFMLS